MEQSYTCGCNSILVAGVIIRFLICRDHRMQPWPTTPMTRRVYKEP